MTSLLIDTHLILWAASAPDRLPLSARHLMDAPENELHFSAASLWEIAIKASLGRSDFMVDLKALRRGLLLNGWRELAINGAHTLAVLDLPALHKDPFDRIFIAQAMTESMLLLTSDAQLGQYPGPIMRV